MDIKCPKCGFVMPEDSSFCGRCGCDLTKAFCAQCGKPLVPGAKFCMHCGTEVNRKNEESFDQKLATEEAISIEEYDVMPIENDSEQASVLQKEEESGILIKNSQLDIITDAKITSDKTAEKTERIAQNIKKEQNSMAGEAYQQQGFFAEKDIIKVKSIIGKNADYYLNEFRKIEAGRKAKFNWAAFLLCFAFCFYRKCGNLAKKYFMLPLILTILTPAILAAGTANLNFTLYTVASLVGTVGGIWIFVNAIRLGKNFNAKYYAHVQALLQDNNEKKYGTSLKNALLSIVIYVAAIAIVSSVSTSLAASSLNKSLYADLQSTEDVITEDMNKEQNSAAGDADLLSFAGKWYGSNLDESGAASDADLLGVILNISVIDGEGYASLKSNTNSFYPWFCEQTYQGDDLLPITKGGDNKWKVNFDEIGESGEKIGGIYLTLTVNPLGELYAEITDSFYSDMSRIQLQRGTEWLNGQYKYYDEENSYSEYGTGDNTPLTALSCEDILRDSVYGKWYDSTGTSAGSIWLNPGEIYIYKARGSFYRDNSIYITFSYQNNPDIRHEIQLPGWEGEIYIDGECYYKNPPAAPITYSNDSSGYYMLPTDSCYITYSDLAPFTKEEVALIRNEIYARYGCIFSSEKYRSYFNSQSWYYPVEGRTAATFDASLLNDYEVKNIDTIVAYEKQMGWR